MTAADQPTTELSEADVVEAVAKALADDWNPGRDPVLTAMFRDYAQTAVTAAAGLLVLAPQPAADTFTLSTYRTERDLLVAAADSLAHAIAPAEVIGEHVGDNDPRENALAALADERRQHSAELARLEAVVSAVRKYAAQRRGAVGRELLGVLEDGAW